MNPQHEYARGLYDAARLCEECGCHLLAYSIRRLLKHGPRGIDPDAVQIGQTTTADETPTQKFNH